jgi:hypothetical protein
MKVITYATKKAQYYDSLEDSCSKFNYELVTLGLNTTWHGMSDKIKAVKEYLDTLDDQDQLVLVVDAYDVIACRDSKEIESVFSSCFDQKHVIFNAERPSSSYYLTWLWNRSYSSKTMGDTKYNKLNAGVVMAKTKVLKEFYQSLIHENNLYNTHAKSDQKLIYNIIDVNERNIKVDGNCNIFTTFGLSDDISVRDGKLFNSHTSTYPFFVHGPGKNTKMDDYIDAVGVKRNFTRNAIDHHNINNKYINIDILILIGILLVVTAIVFGLRYLRK